MLIRTLTLIAFTALAGCEESPNTIAPLEKSGTAYELQIDPKWTDEFRRGLPEMLIFNVENQCVYYSAGFNKENFTQEMHAVFFGGDDESTVSTEDFVKNNPDVVEKIRESIEQALPDATSDEKQEALESALGDVAEQYANKGGSVNNQCTSSISQNLSLIQDLHGNSVEPNQFTDNNKFTIIEYWAAWCLPCKHQRRALDDFIEKNQLDVTFLHVERDAEKQGLN